MSSTQIKGTGMKILNKAMIVAATVGAVMSTSVAADKHLQKNTQKQQHSIAKRYFS